jgi:hypothetical protein
VKKMKTIAITTAERFANQFSLLDCQPFNSARRLPPSDADAESPLLKREMNVINTIVTFLIFATTIFHSHGQPEPGTVNFANASQTALTNSAGTPFPPVGSSAYSVGLYWGTVGTSESSLEPLPAARNGVTRTWYGDGKFNGGIASFPIEGGTQIQLQVRLWAGSYRSYEEAALNDPSPLLARGIIQLITLGNAPGTVPTLPADINFPPAPTDTPFRAFLVPVPEPSTTLLLLLALPFLAMRWLKR